MTKKVVTVKAEDDVSDVARIMRDKHIKRVPVLDDEGHLIGIVSRQDIVKMLL
ncbi:MAG: CBS domain-containing protein [Selenomonas sp.]|nr:CBS domain-containing protein [Selenomonas sp.]